MRNTLVSWLDIGILCFCNKISNKRNAYATKHVSDHCYYLATEIQYVLSKIAYFEGVREYSYFYNNMSIKCQSLIMTF